MTTLPETGVALTQLGNARTTMRDGRNRPVVVVTGMGVITSLGEGKTENWKKLTAGESGISTVRRGEPAFPKIWTPDSPPLFHH